MCREQLHGRYTGLDERQRNFKGGHTLEYRQQCVLVDAVQYVVGLVREQYLRSLHSCLVVLARMHHHGDFLCKPFLQRAQPRILLLLGLKSFDFLFCKVGEYPYVFCSIGITHVKPELIELVGRSAFWVEPHVARLGLAKFATVGLGDKRAGERIRLAAIHAADKFGASGHVPPLVGTAHLQLAPHGFIQVQEVIPLQQLVRKLGERHTVLRVAAKALLHRILCHHIVDGNVLAYVADEIKETIVLHPVIVVDKDGVVGRIAVKVEELGKLPLYAFLIVAQCRLVDENAFLRFHRRVAYHARGTTHKCNGTVARPLQMLQHHHAHQVAYVQRVGRGVDAQVGRGHFLVELFFGARHHVVNHAAPFQFFNKIHRIKFKTFASANLHKNNVLLCIYEPHYTTFPPKCTHIEPCAIGDGKITMQKC